MLRLLVITEVRLLRNYEGVGDQLRGIPRCFPVCVGRIFEVYVAKKKRKEKRKGKTVEFDLTKFDFCKLETRVSEFFTIFGPTITYQILFSHSPNFFAEKETPVFD